MSRTLKIIAAAVLVVILVVGALVAWRVLLRGSRESKTGFALLTPMPGAIGFEPKERPSGPVLRNRAPASLAVDFGYKVGGVPYEYSMTLAFQPGAEQGRASVMVHRDGHDASTDSDAVRRFDEPRKAYTVALADKFMITPPVPALCIKAVVGPDLARYDLADGTICVAQRGTDGTCHPETLACGLLR